MSDIDYARAGDLWIAYRSFGSGPIDLLQVGGLVTNLEMIDEMHPLARFYEQLSRFARVITFDKRGTGLSDRVPNIAPEDILDDITAVLDAVGSDRPVLFGSQEGGAIAALFAATYPQRTSSLILYGTYARRRIADDYPWGITDEMHERIVSTYEARWGREPIGMRRAAPRYSKDPAFLRWWLRAQRLGASPGAALAWYRMTAEIDVRDVLPTIQAPTLVLHRKDDRVFDVANARYIAEHVPGSKLVELPGDDHLVFEQTQDDVIAEMEEFLTGQRPEVGSDRTLATILFTDIVASTETAASLGDTRWRQLLDAHDDMARREVERYRGRLVKTTGDGMLAVFDGPARAARCARAVIQSGADLGMAMRAGLHTGECEVRGDDIGGIAVHLAHRICDLAGAGEAVVSQTVKDLVVGSELVFTERGTHELKGIPGSWAVWLLGT